MNITNEHGVIKAPVLRQINDHDNEGRRAGESAVVKLGERGPLCTDGTPPGPRPGSQVRDFHDHASVPCGERNHAVVERRAAGPAIPPMPAAFGPP